MSDNCNAADHPEFENIRVEDDGALTWIVLNRPDRANALSAGMLEEFSTALEHLKTAGGALIGIRGEGKGFCSGYDLGQVGVPRAADPVADRARLQTNLNRFLAIWDHPKPVIAAVHGYCIAGGSQLCVFTDITVVADDARIGEPAVPVGGGYIAPLWSTLVGPKRAKEIAFVPGNSIDGRTAVDWGWANHAVPSDEVIDTVRSIASRIALTPPDVLAMKKTSINRAQDAMGVRNATLAVSDADALLHLSPSVIEIRERMAAEGIKAVIEDYRVPPTTGVYSP